MLFTLVVNNGIQIAQNINIRIPEEGEKVKRLVEIAQERNIDYKPSPESMIALNDFCQRKGIPHPLGHKFPDAGMPAPLYNPIDPMMLPPPGHF